MIEPELAFADLEDDMACATAYLQYVVCYPVNLLSTQLCYSDAFLGCMRVSNSDCTLNFT